MVLGDLSVFSRQERYIGYGSLQTNWYQLLGYLFYAAKDSRSHDQQGLQYILDGLIETDDAFIGGPGGKRGRGTKNTKVVVSVSITEEGEPQFAQMDVANNHSQASLLAYVQKAVV